MFENISILFDLIFPSRCFVCRRRDSSSSIKDGRDSSILCTDCIESIKYIKSPYCFRCGCSLSEFNLSIPICRECKNHPRRFFFQSARAVGIFTGTLREAINIFKYKRKKRLAEPLADLLIKYLYQEKNLFYKTGDYEIRNLDIYNFPEISSIDIIIPVPLHRKRFIERGFNQNELLTKFIEKKAGIPVINNSLVKIKNTSPQVTISGKNALKERRDNVKGTFDVKNPDLIKGKTVLLIDDVFTTGATVNECSKILKRAGAKNVFVLTLAR